MKGVPLDANREQKEQLYRDFHEKVFRYLRSKLSDRELAEDLAQDVFVKAFEHLADFDEQKASASTWIFTITKNTLTDYFRTRRVHEELPESLESSSSVEDEVCNAASLQTLADALKTLPARERDIIILRFYSGKTLREIADGMKISYSYVKILQNKALADLKSFLGNL